MAKAPPIFYLGFIAQVTPLGAALLRRKWVTGARFWVFVWVFLWAVMNLLAWFVGHILHNNNHFLSYIFTPLQGVVILWALSLYQVRPFARLTIRTIIPFFVVAWAAALAWIENTSNFSQFAEPVYSMLALGVVLFTIATRTSEAVEPVVRQDWYWICGGLALHFGALTVLLPLAAVMLYRRPDIVNKAFIVDTAFNIVAALCITIGFLCTPSSTPSGSFSSPAAAV